MFMRKLWQEHKPVILLIVGWRLFLGIVELLSVRFVPLREGFLGPTPWANLDGVHYLSIAQHGYFQFEQAFFPLYPLLIDYVTSLTQVLPHAAALFISHITFLVAMLLFYTVAKRIIPKGALWAVVGILLYPTSFFFAAVYSESLFFFFSILTIYFSMNRRWFWAAVSIALASATRIFGVFLLIIVLTEYLKSRKASRYDWMVFLIAPLGLFGYMYYLGVTYGDPLAFFHVQPAFGAGRSGSELIFLPQVLWRYVRIFVSVPFSSLNYQVALLEFLSFFFALTLAISGWKQKFFRPYLPYVISILILPTLTGSLSSMPRYVMSAVPLFFLLGTVHNRWVRTLVLGLSAVLLTILASLFLRGYFIA